MSPPCPWLLPAQHPLLPQTRDQLRGKLSGGFLCGSIISSTLKVCIRNSPPFSGVITAHLPQSGLVEEAGGGPLGPTLLWGTGQSFLSHGAEVVTRWLHCELCCLGNSRAVGTAGRGIPVSRDSCPQLGVWPTYVAHSPLREG